MQAVETIKPLSDRVRLVPQFLALAGIGFLGASRTISKPFRAGRLANLRRTGFWCRKVYLEAENAKRPPSILIPGEPGQPTRGASSSAQGRSNVAAMRRLIRPIIVESAGMWLCTGMLLPRAMEIHALKCKPCPSWFSLEACSSALALTYSTATLSPFYVAPWQAGWHDKQSCGHT